MRNKIWTWGFQHLCYVPLENLSGGFGVVWSSSLRLEPMERDKNIIHCLVHLEPSPNPWLDLGSVRNAQRASQPFRDMVKGMGLVDLGVSRGRFSWRNGRCGLALSRARLNRAMCDAQWRGLYPSAIVTMLPATFSDNNPLLVNLFSLTQAAWTRDS
ncbi:Endonuclease/exonuclease/phosphatase [Trema orientale]|uniref:Endonuclease/exonuclease/phosphatase n=1 Tax=Trema orientale TaxID=63057 RepID=A0A2P5EGE5_TREOI|nr:Endonuclease/exonuclease/phosphatase [Trema orientale]